MKRKSAAEKGKRRPSSATAMSYGKTPAMRIWYRCSIEEGWRQKQRQRSSRLLNSSYSYKLTEAK